MGRRNPRREPRVPINPPKKFCPECGCEIGTGHSPQCSRK